ncbi:nb-arc and ankyrin domain containing protein [Macrophomina phaseolina MS6]|uniref:Nb-arc and ankyrin domain containing protein n=1 Tax=Macrophomina phaseolina (strain MS6) TaxID=1126212 RepID=K2RJV8_MACPH|nr:nb-arc and ankyrin domain containing protein [Macrophomina phaseolina MS6]
MRLQPTCKLAWHYPFVERQLNHASQVHLIIISINALDEREDDDRDALGDLIADSVRGPLRARLNIFVSYKHCPNLFSEGLRIELEVHNMQYIATFVAPKLQTMQEEKPLVFAKEIMNNCWTEKSTTPHLDLIVTIESVNHHRKGRTAASIQENIRRLPKYIHQLYDSLFKDATPEEMRSAYLLFRWLCFAERPFSICEIQYVLVLSPETKETSIEDISHRTDFRGQLLHMVNTITDVSRGLAEIIVQANSIPQAFVKRAGQLADPSKEPIALDGVHLCPEWSSTVQFIHQTVTNYLLDSRLQTLAESRYKFSREQSNHFIARLCLRYVTTNDFSDCIPGPRVMTDWSETTRTKKPLHTYICQSLKSHLRQVDAAGIDQTLLTCLGGPYNKVRLTNFAIAVGTQRFMESFLSEDLPSLEISHDSLLHWAVDTGLPGIVRSIGQLNIDRHQQGDDPNYALRFTVPLGIRVWEGQNVLSGRWRR